MKQIGKLKSGEVVWEPDGSHLRDHPTVLPLIDEVLGRIDSHDRDVIVEEVDLGRVVGKNIRVKTTGADEIVYARRPGRAGHTRFVKNRAPEPCSSVVVILDRLETGDYVIITAFIGSRCPAEPWDEKWADETSLPYWRNHALVWGEVEVIEGTETTECPW